MLKINFVFSLLMVVLMLSQKIPDVNAKQTKPVTFALATFAGGCFWCMEPPFEKLDGVLSVEAGYSGGDKPNPTYEQVSSGNSGYVEAIQITYDPKQVDYTQLLSVFWENIDPTDSGGQFADRGTQYKPAIYFHDAEQKMLAQESKNQLDASGKFSSPIKTEITAYKNFHRAEEYHQDYYKKNPLHYKLYKKGSGREDFIEGQKEKNRDLKK